MKKVFKYTIIICSLLFICSCDLNEYNETSSNNKSEEVTNDEKENTTLKEERLTYKVCSDDYYNFIKEIAKWTTENSNFFDRYDFRVRMPYLIIAYYPNKLIKDKDFNDEVEKIYKEVYDKLITNDYSSKCGLKATYNYINIEFYNFNSKKDNSPSYQAFKQFDVMEVNKYKTINEYEKSRGE